MSYDRHNSCLCKTNRALQLSSLIYFGMEPRKYNCGPICFPKTDPEKNRSGGSSRASSNSGSQSPLNWSSMVENIFREEIGKMTECFPKETCHGMN